MGVSSATDGFASFSDLTTVPLKTHQRPCVSLEKGQSRTTSKNHTAVSTRAAKPSSSAGKTETRTEAKGRGVCKGQTQWQTPSAEGQTHHQQSARAGPRPPNRAQTRSHARLEREEWPGVAGKLETSPAKHGAVMAPSV